MSFNPQLEWISGPPASGKTARLLLRLKDRLRQRDWGVRLLVPSATMQEHMRNVIARDGMVLRRGTVTTLARFVDDIAARLELGRPPSAAELENLVADLLERRCPSEYEVLARQRGFQRHLSGCVEALALAGVPPERIDGALGEVYGRLLRGLQSKGLALRGTRLEQIASRVSREHLDGVDELLLDGFFNFSNTERALLEKLGQLVVVRVTATEGQLADPVANVRVVAAEDQTHEVQWVVSEVLRLVRQGASLGRIGILMRNPALYGPLVEAMLDRMDVPSRSYLGIPLLSHPVVAFHRQWIAALEAGWESEAVLAALRWTLTAWGGTEAGDELEMRVREALPSNDPGLFAGLDAYTDWADRMFSPADAAIELKRLAQWIAGPVDVAVRGEVAWMWRQRATALRMLWNVLDQTASEILQPLTLVDFWRRVEVNLGELSLHERDERRNVLHVMDLFEARQWKLDHIFAVGMNEGEFPRRFSPDALLTEAMKRGFGMKTLEDRNQEERFLYEMLLTRATEQVVITYPRINAKGDPLEVTSLASALRVQVARPVSVELPEVRPMQEQGQLARGYRRNQAWSASEFELYLNCPWRHFAARGLELQGLPERPAERLNPVLLGNVAHRVIQIWTRDPARDIESIAERELERACREARVPTGYQFERERINLLRNLRLYARYAPEVPTGWQTRLEEPFEFVMPQGGPLVRGRIDRYDISPSGEIYAYDYKYSKADGLDEKYPIQGALYAMALGDGVSRFSFVALREQARPAVIEGATLTGAIQLAQGMIDEVVAGVGAGRVPVEPRDSGNCKYCDFRDACRIRTREAATGDEAMTA